MFVDIREKITGRSLFSGNYDSIKRCVEAAIKDGTSLANADFSPERWGQEVDLTNANLRGGNFTGANMTRCNLDSAVMHGCNMSQADMKNCWLAYVKAQGMTTTGWTTAGAYFGYSEMDKYSHT